jgi:hypothetical protein
MHGATIKKKNTYSSYQLIINTQHTTSNHYTFYALTSVFNRFASLNLKQFDQAGNILMQTA